MRTIGKRIGICPYCMESHELKEVISKENTIFKGEEITFDAVGLYCEKSGELFEDEQIINKNDLSLKDAYREKAGLLTASDIVAIRNKYGISQSDLCILLKWGGKTITRYESHQVQDKAHDMILKKVSEDPGWYIDLLIESQNDLSSEAYKKYYALAVSLYEQSEDYYLRKCIKANCSKYVGDPINVGNTELSFSKIVDVINYFASSGEVKSLYKPKLMRMMWYADFLSYKLWDHSITGLPYLAAPAGVVPECHDYIVKLNGVPCEERIVEDYESYFFHSDEERFPSLADEDKEALRQTVAFMGGWDRKTMASHLNKERAIMETMPNCVISYDYAKDMVLP